MLEGEWQILSVEYGGETIPGRVGTLEITGARFVLRLQGLPSESGRLHLNDRSSPASLDLMWTDRAGAAPGRSLNAIVRVRGGLMQLCYVPEAGAARPGEFASRATPLSPPAVLIRCRRGGRPDFEADVTEE